MLRSYAVSVVKVGIGFALVKFAKMVVAVTLKARVCERIWTESNRQMTEESDEEMVSHADIAIKLKKTILVYCMN